MTNYIDDSDDRCILDATDEEVLTETLAAGSYNYATGTLTAPVTVTTPTNGEQEGQFTRLNEGEQGTHSKRYSGIEPVVFMWFTAIFLSGAVMQNQVLYQTCRVVYHYNETECEPLLGVIPKTEESGRIENEIQPYAAQISMTASLIGSIVPAILTLFVGPWSDKFGRRPLLVVTFGASVLGQTMVTMLASLSSVTPLNPWIYVLACIPAALTGGASAMMTMIFCYVSDVSTKNDKPRRIIYVDMAMALGLVAGTMASSYLLSATNTITVFGTSALLTAITYIYLILCIKESLPVEPKSLGVKFREFFRFGLVKELAHACVVQRPNYDQAIIWIVMAINILCNFIINGEGNIFYLFLRNQFSVTLRQYNFYSSTVIGIKMFGAIFALGILRKVFNVRLTVLAMLALGCSLLNSTVHATAQQWWQMYMGAAFGFMSGVGPPIMQSILAIVVPSTEIGKIYSLVSSVQTITPLGASPLYTMVYNATINTYPGCFNIISVFIYLICFILTTAIFQIQRLLGKSDFKTESHA